MALFQCFYFTDSSIGYWENLECSADTHLSALLQQQLSIEHWHIAEAWRQDNLVCRVVRFPDGQIDCSPDCPIGRDSNALVFSAG